jgi:hypothetical protein
MEIAYFSGTLVTTHESTRIQNPNEQHRRMSVSSLQGSKPGLSFTSDTQLLQVSKHAINHGVNVGHETVWRNSATIGRAVITATSQHLTGCANSWP